MAVLLSVDAKSFDYEAVAELFPTRSKKFNRQLARYRRFDRAADALRFAIEELPLQLFQGAYLEVEEERFNRVKHCAGFPAESVRYCLKTAGVKIEDVEHIGISRDPSAHLHKKILFAAGRARKQAAGAVGRRQVSLEHFQGE